MRGSAACGPPLPAQLASQLRPPPPPQSRPPLITAWDLHSTQGVC